MWSPRDSSPLASGHWPVLSFSQPWCRAVLHKGIFAKIHQYIQQYIHQLIINIRQVKVKVQKSKSPNTEFRCASWFTIIGVLLSTRIGIMLQLQFSVYSYWFIQIHVENQLQKVMSVLSHFWHDPDHKSFTTFDADPQQIPWALVWSSSCIHFRSIFQDFSGSVDQSWEKPKQLSQSVQFISFQQEYIYIYIYVYVYYIYKNICFSKIFSYFVYYNII